MEAERLSDVPTDAMIDLYERHARGFDRDRSRTLQERVWLDRFLTYVQPEGVVLDLGCGMGEPIARYVIEHGFGVVGADTSPTMIELCRERLPDSEWLVADMRTLELDRRFEGVLAWDSFFHLTRDHQRAMFPRFRAHVKSGAPLMFTSGPSDGEAIGSWFGEQLYHASLAAAEYEHLLATNGFIVKEHIVEDPQCGGHTVWLANYHGDD